MSSDERREVAQTPTEADLNVSGPVTADTGLELLVPPLQQISDRYQVLSTVGQGGMGIVYRVRDRETDEVLALKVLKPDIAHDQHMMERFKNELRLAHRITHKNVCRVYDFTPTAAAPYITMEFVEGESLRQRLQRDGTMSIPQAVHVVCQMCAGLREAHAQGIVHRDLKPENVMLEISGDVKIMDFGVARSIEGGGTLTAALVGTPAYMSPEQALGMKVDRRADIYALGLVLYEMLTGVTAFSATTPIALAMKQIHDTPVHPRELEPTLPATLEKTILRCLEKDPARRFQSVEEVERALALHAGITDVRTSLPQPSRASVFTTPTGELPRVARVPCRALFGLVQLMYLCFYFVALARLEPVRSFLTAGVPAATNVILGVLLVSAMLGIAARLYLLTATAFDYSGLGTQFRRIFLGVLLLDTIWALCPALLLPQLGAGLTLACIVPLVYLPFAQRTLVRMAYHS